MRHKYLIVAYDGGTVREYLINTPSQSVVKARARFKQIAADEGWQPFEEIAVYSLNGKNELHNLVTHNVALPEGSKQHG